MTFPTTLPGLTATNPTSGDTLATGPHHTLHGDERVSIDALAAKVGIDSSAVTTSHDYKIAFLQAKGTDVASSSTTNIGAATGTFLDVTGTVTITAFDTVAAGTDRIVRFTGALILTHNGTSLILPGSANITTVANDTAHFRSLGSGNWICIGYKRSAGIVYSVFGVSNGAVTIPSAQVADSTSAGGNTRGASAVDWQTSRGSANQVASGDYSTIAGGRNSRVSGTDSSSTGPSNTVIGGSSHAISESATIGSSANNCGIIGGYLNTISNVGTGCFGSGILAGESNLIQDPASGSGDAQHSVALGGKLGWARYACQAVIGDSFSSKAGAGQWSRVLLKVITTTNTQTVLVSGASGRNLIMENSSMWHFVARITAKRTDATGENSGWEIRGLISRDANAASTAIVGSITTTLIGQDAAASAYAVTAVANTTTGGPQFKVTGENSKTIRWFCDVEFNEIING